MISINNLSYYIGDRPLYENASLHIKERDRIGLIGLNGTGKTTLLRLINGEQQVELGSISKSKECTVGYLNQDLLSFRSEESILQVAMQAFKHTLKIQRQIDEVLGKLEMDCTDKLVHKLAKLQEQFEANEGYTLESRAAEILEGIGFKTKDLQRSLKEFSGGWRMRVMLAKLLLENPSLLMLDEPTNHLDLPSIQWLENYLINYEGAIIIVSHDRQFLDYCTSSTVEVSGQKLNAYSGNYSFYLNEKKLRLEIQKNAFENQQQKIKQTEQFIDRFRAKSTKARQVQSRIKALNKMDKVEDIKDYSASINFQFQFSQKSGRVVSIIENVSKSYDSLNVLMNTSIQIERGDKIALIGANGKGKSTLLRIISGEEPVEGKSQMGYNVLPTFYAQHQLDTLNIENEILEELKQAGSGKMDVELRHTLGCFLFADEDVFKKIKVLSGGEKSRVALAKTLISEANFLLLDEPTNHLDFQSVNILVRALQQYEGTLITVSHDRHFIQNVANKIWYIENYEIKEYLGTYDEFVYWMNNIKSITIEESKPPKKESTKKKPPKSSAAKKQNKIKNLSQELTKVENEIEEFDNIKSKIQEELSNNYARHNLQYSDELDNKLKQTENKITLLNKRWETLVDEIELLGTIEK